MKTQFDRKKVARLLRYAAFGCMMLAEKLDPVSTKKASHYGQK